MHVLRSVCLSVTCSVFPALASRLFFHRGVEEGNNTSSIRSAFTYTAGAFPLGLVAAGPNCPAPYVNDLTLECPKRPQLNVYSCVCACQEQQTASRQSLAQRGSVGVYSSSDLNLGGKVLAYFLLYTSLDVQIHTDTAVAETMLLI